MGARHTQFHYLQSERSFLEFWKSQASKGRNFHTSATENQGLLFDVNTTLLFYGTFLALYDLN